MSLESVGKWGSSFVLGLCMLTASAQAGGPIIFNEEDGQALPWLDSRAVYVVETGDLGVIENTQTAAIVEQAFKRWTEVPTAELGVENLDTILSSEVLEPFKKDITAEDFTLSECTIPELGGTFQTESFLCELYAACIAQDSVNCPSPVIFDQDGSITSLFFGQDSGVVGFSGPILLSTPGDSVEPFRILQALMVLNGAFFDQDPQNSPTDDPLGDLFLEALIVHEFGHFLGLGHSNVNGDTALLNPAVTQTSVTLRVNPPASLGPLDALTTIGTDEVETMYPILLRRDTDGVSSLNTLEKDDEIALSTLYPCTAQALASGRCKESLATKGSISGRVFMPDIDKQQTMPAQGVLVTARRVDESLPEAVLKEAVSQLTGSTFAPLRCNGAIFIDGDNDGEPDNNGDGFLDDNNLLDLEGLFGSCSTPDQAGFLECESQLNNHFLGGGRFFLGQCGFTSLGFSDPRPTGQVQENRFELSGLSPGQYLVEAKPVFLGGFSSPVRTNFVGSTPSIRSDNNLDFAFFPNPQTGEFYNGLANGCGTNPTSCGQESADSSDNPFAYTLISVTAGGSVADVNIFLNTSTTRADILSDPGFDFCGLGDVDGNGEVDQGDILAVVKAKQAYDISAPFNHRADLNEDGSTTFIDIDIITDIVTNPRPLGDSGEIKRGLAPFHAICTAAAQGGCRIQAPVETIGDDGNPRKEVCTTAAALGCQVSGCT